MEASRAASCGVARGGVASALRRITAEGELALTLQSDMGIADTIFWLKKDVSLRIADTDLRHVLGRAVGG